MKIVSLTAWHRADGTPVELSPLCRPGEWVTIDAENCPTLTGVLVDSVDIGDGTRLTLVVEDEQADAIPDELLIPGSEEG